MAQKVRNSLVVLALAGLAACASIPAPSPAEVTRFHDAAALPAAETGTVFIASAPGADENALELSPYKSAVAQELSRLGYSDASADQAMFVAQISADSFRIGEDGGKRGPVSVGLGGSTGSYGSGVGLGIGHSLRDFLDTDNALEAIGLNLQRRKGIQQLAQQRQLRLGKVNIRHLEAQEAGARDGGQLRRALVGCKPGAKAASGTRR